MTGYRNLQFFSSEDLEQALRCRHDLLVDDYYWVTFIAYSIVIDSSTICTRMTGYGNGIIPLMF